MDYAKLAKLLADAEAAVPDPHADRRISRNDGGRRNAIQLENVRRRKSEGEKSSA